MILNRSALSVNEELSLVYAGALETIEVFVKERVKRYKSFASQWNAKPINDACLSEDFPVFEDFVDWKPELEYDKWVWSLSENEKSLLHSWIVSCADKVRSGL